jgi:hypothetical protein
VGWPDAMRPGALPKAKDVREALRPMPTAETKHASPPLGARGCDVATSVLRNERHAAALAASQQSLRLSFIITFAACLGCEGTSLGH